MEKKKKEDRMKEGGKEERCKEEGKEEGKEGRNETWNETYDIIIDMAEKVVIINDISVEKEKVPEDLIAICDYCNCQMGKFSQLKDDNIIGPETFARAIKNGLVPPKEQLDIVKKLGNEEYVKNIIENWKEMAIHSQTPWALCDKCKDIIIKFTEKI